MGMTIPEDISRSTSSISDCTVAAALAKLWALNRAQRADHVAAGGSFCPRCHCWLKPGQTCHCKPVVKQQPPPSPPELSALEASHQLIETIIKGLECRPWLTLKEVQRKFPDATWNDFSTARSEQVERLRKQAWAQMDTLRDGAPLPSKLRTLCEQLVATKHGRTFESCGNWAIRDALKPKLADAYLQDKACPWDNKKGPD